jgi:hypothetical protein
MGALIKLKGEKTAEARVQRHLLSKAARDQTGSFANKSSGRPSAMVACARGATVMLWESFEKKPAGYHVDGAFDALDFRPLAMTRHVSGVCSDLRFR